MESENNATLIDTLSLILANYVSTANLQSSFIVPDKDYEITVFNRQLQIGLGQLCKCP